MANKQCLNCKEVKDLDDFNPQKGGKLGRRSRCKSCLSIERTKYKEAQRNWNYLSKYNITIEEYEVMFKNQNECCKICGTSNPSPRKQDQNFFVDHCHETGKVRGLLCNWCNRGLGYFKDDLDLLNKAMEYINEHKDS